MAAPYYDRVKYQRPDGEQQRRERGEQAEGRIAPGHTDG
jgi:hypothetical protein